MKIEIVDLTPAKRSYRFTSNEDRQRLIECSRKGENLNEVAKHLGIKIKTCLAIAATEREVALKPIGRKSRIYKSSVQCSG